jgi:hypothetical protein
MGAREDHTNVSYYHIQEIFGDKEPTRLTVFGNATCKNAEGTRFYIKPFAIFLPGHTEWLGKVLRQRKDKLKTSGRLISQLLSSGMSPRAFCKKRGIPFERLREAIDALNNAWNAGRAPGAQENHD